MPLLIPRGLGLWLLRPETADWMVLKEGYLYKTKKVKRAFGALQSTKLRFFVLLQEPETLNAQLEYYEGKASIKMYPS